MKHICRVTNIADSERAKNWKGYKPLLHEEIPVRWQFRCILVKEVRVFLQGEKVCKNLRRVPQRRECVEDRDGRVLREFLSRQL